MNAYGKSKVAMEKLLLSGMNGTTGTGEQDEGETRPRYDLVMLRSSNILGPPAPLAALRGTKFTQWLAAGLADVQRMDLSASSGTADLSISAADYKPLTLFEDEYRSYVYVGDIVRIVAALIQKCQQLRETSADADAFRRSVPQVLNMGGPDALNRVQVAHELAAALGIGLTRSVRIEACTVASNDAPSQAKEGTRVDGQRILIEERPKVLPTSRASVDLGYPSPLDVSMDSSLLTQSLGLQMTSVSAAFRTALN